MNTKTLRWIGCLLCIMWASLMCSAKTIATLKEEKQWWLKPHRMIQTNLREIDATMDIDQYVKDIKEFGADVVLFNVGGIVANYPTELKYHWKNTYMDGDLVGQVLDRLHQEGIRMIGRFDFSKLNEKLAADHPEWLYVSEKGETVNYNGQMHTCASGGYQQEYMFKILGEAVDKYPLDGVFFNMIGYPKSDYSGNYHGLCQCQNCKQKFKDFSGGMELPGKVNENNPAYKKYKRFIQTMKDNQFSRVQSFLKAKNPNLCICTYTVVGVDVIRKESNRPLGQGLYDDTHRSKSLLYNVGQRQLANAAVHFMRIPFRHAAVSPYLTTRRNWQQMMGGAWLDFYCIGPLQRQEDRTGLTEVASIFNFHKDNESYLIDTKPAAQVAIAYIHKSLEYQGIFQILSEHHIPFEYVRFNQKALANYPVVIVTDAEKLKADQCRALDGYVNDGGKLLITGKAPAALTCCKNFKYLKTRPPELGSYIRIRPEDKSTLNKPIFDKLDLVFLNGTFHVYQTTGDTEGLLRLIPQDMFGPPEKCYYRQVSEHPAILTDTVGQGQVAFFPWDIGTHYEKQCHQGHANLVTGVLDSVLGLDRNLQIEGSPLLEITHRLDSQDRHEWVGLYNLSGQRDKVIHEPIPMRNIVMTLKPQKPVQSIRLLNNGQTVPFKKTTPGVIRFTIPTLELFDVVLIEYAL